MVIRNVPAASPERNRIPCKMIGRQKNVEI
jgi:hypothetical protein